MMDQTPAHAPGPWAIDEDTREGMEWNRHIVLAADHNARIAFMAHGFGPEMDEANAHLIAAAPDMLAMLKQLVSPNGGEDPDLIEAERVIARAEGAIAGRVARQEAGYGDVITEIASERRRQIEVERWTAQHDDAHRPGELADAAASYASNASANEGQRNWNRHNPPITWPWSRKWWKPTIPRRDLIRAAALTVTLTDALGHYITVRTHPDASGRYGYTAVRRHNAVCAGSELTLQAAINAATREIEART